jgi:asparagine synthase (glutamine-hydrolysing)
MADEAELAGFTARQLGNVDHRVCRPPAGETLRTLSQIHASSVQPMGNLCNLPWFSATIQAAEEANATRLLQGTAGNLTISAGSREFLGDMAEEQGWRAALRTVPFSSGRSAHAWLNSLHVLAGPRLPRHLYLALARLADRYDPRYGQFPTLRPPYRAAAEQVLRDVSPHPGPGRSGFGWRLQLLFNHDHADLFHPSLFRVELRDPTNDPRVVDLMMGMPPQFLVPTPDEPRPLYAKAFGSRLPRAVVQGRTRGYQGADWDRQFPAAEVHARFVSLLRNPLVAELFDGRYLLETVLKRPREPAQLASWPVIRDHRMMLLAALSVADWVDVHFPA